MIRAYVLDFVSLSVKKSSQKVQELEGGTVLLSVEHLKVFSMGQQPLANVAIGYTAEFPPNTPTFDHPLVAFWTFRLLVRCTCAVVIGSTREWR